MTPVATTCGLCDLDCGGQIITRRFEGREMEFCCMGCANVYAILLESGAVASGQNIRETEIFRRSLELGLVSNPLRLRVDKPALGADAPTAEVLYQVGGMWCSACGWLIEHALEKIPGIVSAEVFFASDLAKVKYCPLYLPPEAIASQIAQLGYKATTYSGDDVAGNKETRDLVLRLGVAAFLWANIMAFSVILYVGYFEQIAASANRFLPWVMFSLATPMIFYCALPILRSAAIGIRNLQIRMEALLSLGILTAYGLSISQMLQGRAHIYFDTVAAIVTLVLTGKLIERGAKDRAARSISVLYRLMPNKARIADGSGERFIAIEALQPGTVCVVKAGERVPADGTLIEGEAQVDESLLTGESSPVHKKIGDTLVSGSLNVGGAVRIHALRTGQDSALAQIIRLVEQALSSRAPIERTVDQISRIFVPAVIALALCVFFVLVSSHIATSIALLRAVSILVIACPCALGLATPLAITAALGCAAQQGILISNSRVLESMEKIDTVILDKTGTVTDGVFSLLEFALAEQFDDQAEGFLHEHLPIVTSLEAASEHVLGKAVVAFAREHGIAPADGAHIEIRKGEGITASCCQRQVFVGNRSLALAQGAVPNPRLDALALEWQKKRLTVVYYGWDRNLKGVLAFGDHIKEEAACTVDQLRCRGLSVRLVSGDSLATTLAVATEIGIRDFKAEASPKDKVRIVQELQRSGHRVAVVGDGVNDAPALAQADLGIALGTGADIAMNAAPIVLIGGALNKIDDAFRLATRSRRVVRQNLFWAFFYNTAGLALGIAGVLNPMVAAAAMLLSSASVVANSMRLSRERDIGRARQIDAASPGLREHFL
jgi:heavy metal translocating P-type ATPase